MNKAKRQAVIAGNWKMNKTRPEAKALIEQIKPLVKDADCGVVVCVPYTNLETALEATKGSNIKVGAENCHWAKSGASVPLIGFGHLLFKGVKEAVDKQGFIGTFYGGLESAAVGISGALIMGYLASLVFKSKMK